MPSGNKEQLDTALQSLAAEYFNEELEVAWTEVAAGNGWTGVGPATGCNLALFVPDMEDEKRTSLLGAICENWMRVTGCSINEIVATAVNRDR